MLDVAVEGSDMAREVSSKFDLVFTLNADSTIVGSSPLNTLTGVWRTEGSRITIVLDDREVFEAPDEDLEILMVDFSMGSGLVDSDRFLVSDEGQTLSLFDSTGRMVMRCKAIE